MDRSHFELVLDKLRERPQSLGREVALRLRREGHEQFTARRTNQVLYRMLAAGLVDKVESEGKPRWSALEERTPSNVREPSVRRRPLDERPLPVKGYVVAGTKVKVILLSELSPNDPYLTADWVGTDVVASINATHPFWVSRITSDSNRALYSMLVAIDAYVQWRIAKLPEPPDASAVQMLRDAAFRFCTLSETESTNTECESTKSE